MPPEMNASPHRLLILALGAWGLVGCARAPEATEVEATARAVKVGSVELRIRLPAGAVLDGDYGSSVRFGVPGRGGADVLLTTPSSVGDLLELTASAAKQSDADGRLPDVVRSETVDGGHRVTSVGTTGKMVRVLVTMPVTAQNKAVSCYANVTRSQPIADLDGTRKALETVCESIALVP